MPSRNARLQAAAHLEIVFESRFDVLFNTSLKDDLEPPPKTPRDHVITLLRQAQCDARSLHEPILDYLIERALDEARAGAFLPAAPQARDVPIPQNVVALIRRAAKRGGEPQ